MKDKIGYFLQHAQATPVMSALHAITRGALIADRRSAVKDYKQVYPESKIHRIWPFFSSFSSAYQLLSDLQVLVHSKFELGITRRFPELKRVMVFHGTYRILGEQLLEDLNKFKLLLLNSPRQEKALNRIGSRLQCDYQIIGYLPFDHFPKPTPEVKRAIKLKYHLAEDKPTVVFAPARRAVGSWLAYALAIAKETPTNMNLILRPHPNQIYSATSSEKALYRQILEYAKTRSHLVLDLGLAKFPELLCIADVLISDATSPAEESLYYDIPQLLADINNKAATEAACRDVRMHPDDIDDILKLYHCGPNYTKEKYRSWAEAIDEALSTADRYQQARQDYFFNAFGNRREGIALAGAKAIDQLL
ncbi:MAG: hypothetical protein K0R12_851 [Gammaproteobacteria bacterium]|jgi:hypothetical protein|nr:hypothetical protein [Gammaproteobacteria bacterium]